MFEAEFRLEDKVILVTGAAGLIGREVCDAYAAYGARLVLCDIAAQETLAAQARRLQDRYPHTTHMPAHTDITDDDAVQALAEAVRERFGRLDVLVNLAAIDAKFDAAAGEINPSRFENYPWRFGNNRWRSI